jgi:branched-subunit amino acid ABC-type transport system permease component
MTNIFLQLLINGIIAGAIYALVASGFSLIYSTNKFVHFAHGGVIALSAYFLFWLFSNFGLNFYLAALLTILFSSILGYLLNQFFYKPLRAKKSSPSILLIASIAILILLESLILLFFGANVKTINFIESNQGIGIAGTIITPLQIIIILISATLFLSLFVLMKKTRIGKAMRAVADNKDVAEIVGISSEKIYCWSFIIGSTIAGVAAILISLEQNIFPTMGANLMIKGFTGAIIGGVGSVSGAILGSFFLGIVENFGIWFLPSGYKDAIAFSLLFIFLLFRPQGFLGIKNNQK